MTVDEARLFGYDAGRHGPNTLNCHFSIFSTPEFTRAWERGNAAGKLDRSLATESAQSGSIRDEGAEDVKP